MHQASKSVRSLQRWPLILNTLCRAGSPGKHSSPPAGREPYHHSTVLDRLWTEQRLGGCLGKFLTSEVPILPWKFRRRKLSTQTYLVSGICFLCSTKGSQKPEEAQVKYIYTHTQAPKRIIPELVQSN